MPPQSPGPTRGQPLTAGDDGDDGQGKGEPAEDQGDRTRHTLAAERPQHVEEDPAGDPSQPATRRTWSMLSTTPPRRMPHRPRGPRTLVNRLVNPLQGQPLPLGSAITAAGQRLSAELDQALAAAGFTEVRAAHARFVTIDPGGTRVTDLAARMRITERATGELVRHLRRHGYVEVQPDPDDQRVRRVALTPRGWQAVTTGQQVVTEFDRWLARDHRR